MASGNKIDDGAPPSPGAKPGVSAREVTIGTIDTSICEVDENEPSPSFFGRLVAAFLAAIGVREREERRHDKERDCRPEEEDRPD